MFNRFVFGPLMDDDPAPGAGGNPASFDFAAFEKRVVGEFNKGINALDKKLGAVKGDIDNVKNEVSNWKEKLGNQQPPPAPDPGSGDKSNDKGDKGESADRDRHREVIAQLEKRVKASEAALEQEKVEREKTKREADERDVDSFLRNEISKHELGSERARADLFKLLRSDVKRGDDGKLYGADDLPLDEFVKNEIIARPNYIPPQRVNGTGAPASGSTPTGGGSKSYKIEDLTSENFKDPNKLKAAAEAIRQAYSESVLGQ